MILQDRLIVCGLFFIIVDVLLCEFSILKFPLVPSCFSHAHTLPSPTPSLVTPLPPHTPPSLHPSLLAHLPRYIPPPSHNQKTTQLEEVIDTQKQDIEFLKTQIQSLTNSSAPSEEDRSTSEVSLGLGSSFNSTIESGPLKQQLVKLRNALRVCCV